MRVVAIPNPHFPPDEDALAQRGRRAALDRRADAGDDRSGYHGVKRVAESTKQIGFPNGSRA